MKKQISEFHGSSNYIGKITDYIEVMCRYLRFCLFSLAIILTACRSPQIIDAPLDIPLSSELNFISIEAESPALLMLNFELTINFPPNINISDSSSINFIHSWYVEMNSNEPLYESSGFYLDYSAIYRLENYISRTAYGNEAIIPLLLSMDINVLEEFGLAPRDDYEINLILILEYTDNSGITGEYRVTGLAEFPGVRTPVFNITSIAILQAELVNTGFRVGITITNPNPYPVDLSRFSYTLYGNGMEWADGRERDIIRIPAKTIVSGNIFLVMNFIDMDRALLNQIIRLEDVNYRFTGEAEVITGVNYLPVFISNFDLRGYSRVYPE